MEETKEKKRKDKEKEGAGRVWVVHESYRHGLDRAEDFQIDRLEYDEGSFVALGLVWEAERDCVVRVSEGFSYTPENLTNYAPKGEGLRFRFVEPVMTERGAMWDRLSEDAERQYRRGEPIVMFAVGRVFRETYPLSITAYEMCDHGPEDLRPEDHEAASGGTGSRERVFFRTELKGVFRGTLPGQGSCFEFWQHPATLARYYGLAPYGEEHFGILKGYLKALGALGVSSATVIVSDAPWDGQRKHLLEGKFVENLFEVSMVRVKRRRPLELDFSALDRYIRLCRECGIGPGIDLFGLMGLWGREGMRLWSEADGAYLSDEEAEQYAEELYRHFKEKGYEEVSVCVDEPQDPEALRREIVRARMKFPEWRIKGAFDRPEVCRALASELDEYSTSFFLTCREELRTGTSWYICCGPDEPNTFVSGSLAQIRGMAYLSHCFGILRLLRWSAFAFGKDVRREGRFAGFRAGDGFFLYPGRYGNPELSLRYIQLLRLREDMALLDRARKEKGREEVLKQVKKICKMEPERALLPDFQVAPGFICASWRDYEQVRRELLKNYI